MLLGQQIYYYGKRESETVLIQMIERPFLRRMPLEIDYIKEFAGTDDFLLAGVRVSDWNEDLTPWVAPGLFGKKDFSGLGPESLDILLNVAIPAIQQEHPSDNIRLFLGGYSLSALFALWAAYKTDVFSGVAAASPSMWYPHFTEFMESNEIQTDAVYLSIGDKEEKIRNPVMKVVGDEIRKADQLLTDRGVYHTLEWNEGKHFADVEKRTAMGFAWLLKNRYIWTLLD